MRALSPFIVLGLAAFANAQTPLTGADLSVQNMLQRLHDRSFDPISGVSGLSITMNGVQRQGVLSSSIGAQVFFRYAPPAAGRADLKVNLINFHRDASGRVVTDTEAIEDGKTLWRYNPIAKTYSAAAYDLSPTSGPTSDTYLHDGLFALNEASSATGAPSFATRMLQEMFAYSQVTYHPWIPSVAGPTTVASRYQDPITGYYKNPTTGLDQVKPATLDPDIYYIVYASVPRRAIAFEIYVDPNRDVSDPDKETIQRIYITEGQAISQRNKTTSWTLFVTPTTDFSQARFAAINSASIPDWPQWRPIVSAAPVKN